MPITSFLLKKNVEKCYSVFTTCVSTKNKCTLMEDIWVLSLDNDRNGKRVSKMRKEIVDDLFEEFQKNEFGKATVMKFMYTFRDVEVSAYFDGYDEKLPMLTLILKYKTKVDLVSLNLYELSGKSMEHAEINQEIREKIVYEDSYELFINRLFQELEAKEYVFRNYKADLPFKQLQLEQYNRSGVHPFFGGFEPGKMELSYMKLLYERFTLSWELLEMLQQKGVTIRTVGKCKERKKFGKELEKLV